MYTLPFVVGSVSRQTRPRPTSVMASHAQTLLETLDLKLSEIDVESPTQVEQREVEELIARLYRERCGANIVLQLRD
jgi:hypothetical protein